MTATTEILTKNWIALHFKVQEKKIAEAFELFRKNDIEPILIKGWAVARLYPPERQRPFADIDLCVDQKDFDKAHKIIQSEKAKRLNIDLHCGLRHLDTLEWNDLYENSKLEKIDETPIRILRSEDHLRVVCVHWLTDGAARKERLWDIYYLFRSKTDFDWGRCLNQVSENRRRWIICTIGLVEKYLTVSLENTPFEFNKIEIPVWLIKACEKEWNSSISLKPLQNCLKSPKEIIIQLKKRFPPNPIQATVETEGSFDSRTRIYYQTRNYFERALQSAKRFKDMILKR